MMRVALTTFADETSAANCARQMVSERLAACGMLLPGARSFYLWEGNLEDSAEVAVLFKMPAEAYERFASRLAELHPYTTPELLAWDCDSALPAYEAWARDICS